MIRNTDLVLVGGMSRSGTTLLSSVLEAHPDVAGGAELIPGKVQSLGALRDALDMAVDLSDDLSQVSRHIKRRVDPQLGSLVMRCYRAGSDYQGLQTAIESMLSAGIVELDAFDERFAFAVMVIRQRMRAERRSVGSFKLNSPSVSAVLQDYSNAHVVCLIRHPCDVYDSHIRKNFGKSLSDVCRAWNNYSRAFIVAKQHFPDRVELIKYEDFVANPQDRLIELTERWPINFSERMIHYEQHDSKILQSRHPNTEQLSKGIYVERAARLVSADEQEEVLNACKEMLAAFDYQ